MTTPRPTLPQCRVLHEIDDGRAWQRGHHWYVTGSHRDIKVTQQVKILIAGGWVTLECDRLGEDPRLHVTAKGHQVLQRRPWGELVEKLNSSR